MEGSTREQHEREWEKKLRMEHSETEGGGRERDKGEQ